MCRSPTEQHFILGGQTTKILGAARFQPGTAGCEAQKLPLCCAAPFKIGSFVMLPRNLRKYVWIFCLCMQRDRFLLTVTVPILMELNPNRLIFF